MWSRSSMCPSRPAQKKSRSISWQYRGSDYAFASRAHSRTSRGADRECASAPDHEGHREWFAACTTLHGFRASAAGEDSQPCTGRVFTVKMPHHRGDQACAVDTLGLNIKCPDKYNMPQSGDVMVAVSQIQEQIVDVGGKSIKCPDKYNMPQSGDVMVAVSQIQEQIVDVGGKSRGSFVKFLRSRLWRGSRNQFAVDTSRMSRRLARDGLHGTQPVEAVAFRASELMFFLVHCCQTQVHANQDP